MNITNLVLQVKDLTKMKSFYHDKLGLPVLHETNDEVQLGFEDTLLILKLKENAVIRKMGAGLYHVAYLFDTDQDLSSMIRHLVKENVSFNGAADHHVSKAFYLNDPEGNGIELYADTDKNVWEVEGKLLMTVDPLDVDTLLESTSQAKVVPYQIGHVHLSVSNLEDAVTYFKTLELEETYRYQNAVFLSKDGYHHHVAVNTWQGPRIPAEDETGIISFDLNNNQIKGIM